MPPSYLYGLDTLFRLASPAAQEKRSMRGVDMLRESWQAPSSTSLVPGDVHPDRPGMIIIEVDAEEEMPGAQYVLDITAEGSLDNSLPKKTLSNGRRRTLDVGFDERVVACISWHSFWKSCTAVASTDVVNCTAHGFPNGQRVVFARTTGGAGITPQSSTSLGVIVHVIDRTADTFKVSATSGGSALDITTDMSAGEVIAAEFALGSPHPSFPYMFITELQGSDENTPWARCDVTYKGLEEYKPHKRIISVNGQAMTSSGLIYWSFADGGSGAARRAVNLPQIVVTDYYLTISSLATETVPLSQSEGGTPPSPPSVRTVVITGSDDELIYQWPAYWSRMAVAHADTLNSALGPSLQIYTSEYRWPVLLT